MSDVYLVPQKSTFEIQDFTYVYVVDKEGIVKVRSFQPLQRYEKFYITEDLEPDTYIVYEGFKASRTEWKFIRIPSASSKSCKASLG